MIVMFVVVLLFVMGVGVAVGMAVAVIVAMRMSSMIMPVMVVTKTRHSHQINRQSKRTNHKQLRQPLRLMSLLQSLGRLETNLNTDKHQEHTISKSRQCLNFAETVRKALGGWPFGGYGGEETQAKGDAVEEHMDGVGEEAKGVGGEAVEGLDDHECEVQARNLLEYSLRREERGVLLDEVKDSP